MLLFNTSHLCFKLIIIIIYLLSLISFRIFIHVFFYKISLHIFQKFSVMFFRYLGKISLSLCFTFAFEASFLFYSECNITQHPCLFSNIDRIFICLHILRYQIFSVQCYNGCEAAVIALPRFFFTIFFSESHKTFKDQLTFGFQTFFRLLSVENNYSF